MPDLFRLTIPENRWREAPASIACCVFDALVNLGLFAGKEVWQNDLWSEAQLLRWVRSGYRHKPTHETLARALRGRGDGSNRLEVRDYLESNGIRVVEERGRVRLEAT